MIVFDTDFEFTDLLASSPQVCRVIIALAGDDFQDIVSTTTTHSVAAVIEEDEGFEKIDGARLIPSNDPNVNPFLDIRDDDDLSMVI